MSSQAQMVQDYLLGPVGKTAGITGLEALQKFGVGHLPSVMRKISRDLPPGVAVEGEWEGAESQFGKKSFKRYFIRAVKRDERQPDLFALVENGDD